MDTDDQKEQKQHHAHKQWLNELLEFVRKSLIENKKFITISLEVRLALLLPHAAESLGFEVKSFTISDLVSFLQKLLDHAKKLLLSEVIKVGKLMLVMPAINAVSERSFCALKRVKTYHRYANEQPYGVTYPQIIY